MNRGVGGIISSRDLVNYSGYSIQRVNCAVKSLSIFPVILGSRISRSSPRLYTKGDAKRIIDWLDKRKEIKNEKEI